MSIVKKGVVALASAMAMLGVGAGSAFASSQYPTTSGGGVAGQTTGNLPFTGAELLVYVVVGLAIVGSGLALRAMTARRSAS
ncbi:MAG: hypothetical protein ACXVY5_03575 [Gaiellales bacterium]